MKSTMKQSKILSDIDDSKNSVSRKALQLFQNHQVSNQPARDLGMVREYSRPHDEYIIKKEE